MPVILAIHMACAPIMELEIGMTDMTAAWSIWSDLHHQHGFAIGHHLNGSAVPEALALYETELGMGLPEDLRELWLIADGQVDSFGISDPAPGSIISPVFGSYDMMSVKASMDAYRGWSEVLRDFGKSMNDGITVRAGDPVHPDYWRPGWIPFAIDGGGNHYAVDMDPAAGGTLGQVILMGPDEDERRVLGTGLAAWFVETAARRPEINDEAELPLGYFDMEP